MAERAPRADAQRNRELLLQAAAELLAARPDATLAEIADRAGVGRATAYRHFPTVDALHDAFRAEAVQAGVKVLQEQVAPLLAGQEPGVGIAETIRRMIEPVLRDGSRFGAVVSSQKTTDEVLVDQFLDLATAVVARGQHSGEFTTEVSARALAITLARLITRTTFSHERGELDTREACDVIEIFLRGMAAPAR
jgi:AcrR family transcriptional regulator